MAWGRAPSTPLSFLDQLNSYQKNFQTFLKVKFDINRVNLTPCQAHWVLQKVLPGGPKDEHFSCSLSSCQLGLRWFSKVDKKCLLSFMYTVPTKQSWVVSLLCKVEEVKLVCEPPFLLCLLQYCSKNVKLVSCLSENYKFLCWKIPYFICLFKNEILCYK